MTININLRDIKLQQTYETKTLVTYLLKLALYFYINLLHIQHPG